MKKTNYETKLLSALSSKRDRVPESGRSMVEMLGVLAIVGVISIGGIAGYIYGMNRYRTNEILDGASKRAVLVASQLASEIDPNLTEFVDYDETAGGSFSSDVELWENEFGIQIRGVKQEVCENLIRMIGTNTPLRAITTIDAPGTELVSGGCAEGTGNDLYLVYNLEMLSKQAVDSGSRDGSAGGGGVTCEAWESESGGTCACDNAKCLAYCPPTEPGSAPGVGASLSSEKSGCNNPNPDEATFYGDCVCSYPCFPGDTLITLADGSQKRADEITYNDELLVWNFDEGRFDKAKPLWIKEEDIAMAYNVIRFSNGAELKTVDDHRIFNKEKGAFTYPMLDNENTPVGTHTFTANGEWVTLESKDVVHEKVAYYNIITERHMNCFANGILTSCRLNNIYPIKDMKFVKDDRELIPYSVYAELPRRWYDGLRLAEQPLDVNRNNSVTYHGTTIVEYVRHLMGKQQVGDVSLLEKVA